MIALRDGQDTLEVWKIDPPLPAVGARPEVAARIIHKRRGNAVAFDLTSEQVLAVIRQLQGRTAAG
jgi:hypothetical protein